MVADVAAEQVFSVDVELADGTKTVLRFEAESSGEAYRQAQNTPNVRRVGRVTAGHRSASSSLPSPSSSTNPASSRSSQPVREQRSPVAQSTPTPGLSRDQLLGNVIGGPRVVREARLLGFERPFAKLQAPPRSESVNVPKPAEDVKPIAPRPSALAIAAAKLAAEAAAAEAKAAEAKAAEAKVGPATSPVARAGQEKSASVANGREYRIIKSRRKEGSPYFLQRGVWSQQGSKRVFDSNWEKGFDSREAAEQHQAWAEKMAAEIAELNSANG